jgi:hypothetical protein
VVSPSTAAKEQGAFSEPPRAGPRWPAVVGLVLCVAGLGVASYLTYAHYDTHIQLACPDKGVIPAAWRSTNPVVRRVRLGSTVIGIGFVCWLLYAELVKIQKICLYCTSVHVLTFLLFVVTIVATVATAPLPED